MSTGFTCARKCNANSRTIHVYEFSPVNLLLFLPVYTFSQLSRELAVPLSKSRVDVSAKLCISTSIKSDIGERVLGLVVIY